MHSFDTTFENFVSDVMEASQEVPILVDFWAPWCGPCQSLMPMLTKLADEYNGAFRLAKVNIDEQQQLASQFGVRSVPTVKLMKDGQVVDEFTGALPESQLRSFLDQHIERESDNQMAEVYAAYKNGDSSAVQKMIEIANADPSNTQVRLQLADVLIQEKQYDEAKQLLESLPYETRQQPQVAGMLGRLEFLDAAKGSPNREELEKTIADNPGDLEARYQLSSLLITQAEYEAAMDQLLEILKRDRSFGDDAARKGMLKVFDMLGGSGELVSRYRQRMSTALY
jgi:putative thioredoxin